MKKYVAYIRESTKKQERSGLGFKGQISMIKSYVDENEIDRWFKETESAKTIENRLGLKAAIEYARDNDMILVVAKLDRLARNTEESLWINRRLEGSLLACDMPRDADGKMNKLMYGMFSLIAEAEREWISKRTKMALAEKKAKGEVLGAPMDYWSMGKRIEKMQRTIKAKQRLYKGYNEANFQACRVYLEQFLVHKNKYDISKKKGEPKYLINFAEVAQRLNDLGYRTTRGNEWCESYAKDIILRNFKKYFDLWDKRKGKDGYKQILHPPKLSTFEVMIGGESTHESYDAI